MATVQPAPLHSYEDGRAENLPTKRSLEVYAVSYPPEKVVLIDLEVQQNELYESATQAASKRAGSTVYRGNGVRQTMVVLLQDAEMAEHSSPEEGFIHVIQGAIRLDGDNRSWEVSAGQLLPVPPERHSVTALDDTVLTLTVLRQQ